MARFVGYTVQQYITKTIRTEKRATGAYEAILEKIPKEISDSLGPFIAPPLKLSSGCASRRRAAHVSLVPLAQTAHTPIHKLTGRDGLSGGQYQQQRQYQDFIRTLAKSLMRNLRRSGGSSGMIDWPEDLVVGRCCAAFCSLLGRWRVAQCWRTWMACTRASGLQFLKDLASLITEVAQQAEVMQCVDDADLLTACELVRKYLSAPVFKTEMLKEFSGNGYRPAKIHDDLSLVNSRLVMTTKLRQAVQNRANQLQDNTVIVKNYYDKDVADVFRRRDRVVIKVHGTIDAPDSTIFTRSQYALAEQITAIYTSCSLGIFVTHAFVFLGASMRDPDMQLLLEDHAYRFEGSRPHYIVMPEELGSSGHPAGARGDNEPQGAAVRSRE